MSCSVTSMTTKRRSAGRIFRTWVVTTARALTLMWIGRPAKTWRALSAAAIAHSVHSADVVLNILARHRDPEPAATILTPDALRLRHAPIADCARYDRLRRAS